jgi:hypothetical protein
LEPEKQVGLNILGEWVLIFSMLVTHPKMIAILWKYFVVLREPVADKSSIFQK